MMTGKIDPLFENHPFFTERKKATSDFLDAFKQEQEANAAWDSIKDLEGPKLDEQLRRLGFDPDELLASFDRTMALVPRKSQS